MVALGAASVASAAHAADGSLAGLPATKPVEQGASKVLDSDAVGGLATKKLSGVGNLTDQAGGVLKKTSPTDAGKAVGMTAPSLGGLPIGG